MTKYNKLWVALVGALVAWVANRYGGQAADDVVALLTALGVWAVPNQ